MHVCVIVDRNEFNLSALMQVNDTLLQHTLLCPLGGAVPALTGLSYTDQPEARPITSDKLYFVPFPNVCAIPNMSATKTELN